MKKYKLIIFDLDGTLLDTSEGILSSVEFAIKQKGKTLPDGEILKTFIGPPIQNSFAKTFDITGTELDDMALCFRNHYKDYDLLKAKPYDGIYKLCNDLKTHNYLLGVATYKREDYAKKILEYFHFNNYISVICGSDFNGKLTKAEIIKNSISVTGIKNYKDVVMVGDTKHDAIGAQSLGIDFIGVTYGFGFKAPGEVIGENIVGIANNTNEIFEILMGEKK